MRISLLITESRLGPMLHVTEHAPCFGSRGPTTPPGVFSCVIS